MHWSAKIIPFNNISLTGRSDFCGEGRDDLKDFVLVF